uniref:NADH-ubiquinone oxidoreductase chain 3 n=1 Tax=Pseudocellus gertschi TaxID=1329481 RepID=W5R4L1_9ARAC|nr:NADH dehydrogenase subunit 3 [Pseudocellus gertschi]AGL11938.1 NADH dehydrogenase subunit 3 [Pseudocellus gertschi]
MMLYMITVMTLISIIIMTLCITMMKKTMQDLEKTSCFECGFNPMSPTRTPFSLRFFLLAILFLIFDVEISLLLPFPLSSINTNFIITSITFLTILNLGLLYEWMNQSLEWK